MIYKKVIYIKWIIEKFTFWHISSKIFKKLISLALQTQKWWPKHMEDPVKKPLVSKGPHMCLHTQNTTTRLKLVYQKYINWWKKKDGVSKSSIAKENTLQRKIFFKSEIYVFKKCCGGCNIFLKYVGSPSKEKTKRK